VRPFAAAAQVQCRGYSLGLQRVLSDFGADTPFNQVPQKVREHYGIEVSPSAVRVVSEARGEAMEGDLDEVIKLPAKGMRRALAEMDGSMIPIVEIAEGVGDKRRRREVSWQEARLSLVGAPQSQKRYYAATLGSVSEAGRQWKASAVCAGVGSKTRVHCVGDGARWIINQAQAQFGAQAGYLVDFYHVSEYLAAAAAVIEPAGVTRWLHLQQQRLKANQVEAVLAALAPYEESESVPDTEAAVRVCVRYLRNHIEHLDYKTAIAEGLPIGSGEIESGHRTVIQARLKVSGAWWRVENAEKMLALRVARANGEWETYWAQQRQAHA
jgi:uncharacterized protein UPF0236